jgi:hypothetical protein
MLAAALCIHNIKTILASLPASRVTFLVGPGKPFLGYNHLMRYFVLLGVSPQICDCHADQTPPADASRMGHLMFLRRPQQKGE